MTIEKQFAGNVLTLVLEGRLDTTTAPLLEKELKESLGGIASLILDFAKIEYISSAGLRVLLFAQKTMAKQGTMKLIHVNADVQAVFDLTGFSSLLNIE